MFGGVGAGGWQLLPIDRIFSGFFDRLLGFLIIAQFDSPLLVPDEIRKAVDSPETLCARRAIQYRSKTVDFAGTYDEFVLAKARFELLAVVRPEGTVEMVRHHLDDDDAIPLNVAIFHSTDLPPGNPDAR
jgi:hypothetical protein